MHYQNYDQLEQYIQTVAANELPIHREVPVPTKHQELVREVVLQLKEGGFRPDRSGRNSASTFCREFAAPLRNQEAAGYLSVEGDEVG